MTSSCTSVYVDGSETRGAVNAQVLVKYGTLTGSAEFTVWFPVTPLDVHLEDTKLSQVRKEKSISQLIKEKLKPRPSNLVVVVCCSTHFWDVKLLCDHEVIVRCEKRSRIFSREFLDYYQMSYDLTFIFELRSTSSIHLLVVSTS